MRREFVGRVHTRRMGPGRAGIANSRANLTWVGDTHDATPAVWHSKYIAA